MYITANGGEFHIGKKQIEFYVPEEYSDFVAMKFPFLQAEQYVWSETEDTFWPPES